MATCTLHQQAPAADLPVGVRAGIDHLTAVWRYLRIAEARQVEEIDDAHRPRCLRADTRGGSQKDNHGDERKAPKKRSQPAEQRVAAPSVLDAQQSLPPVG